MCVDPQDRANGTQRRASTRITEYALDEERGAASLISSYDEGGFALFAGGVVQLPNGNRLIGWAAARESVASEINGQGQRIWSIRDTNTDLPKRPRSEEHTYEIKSLLSISYAVLCLK